MLTPPLPRPILRGEAADRVVDDALEGVGIAGPVKEPPRVHARHVRLADRLEGLPDAATRVVDGVLELPILHPLDLGDGEVAGAPVWEVEAGVRLEDALDAPELVAAI